MKPERSGGRRAVADIVTGAALGLALGAVAAIGDLRGKRRGTHEQPAQAIDDTWTGEPGQATGTGIGPPAHAPTLAELRPGWRRVESHALPQPTYWPAAMAFGIALLLWGILASPLISAVGLALFALALARWIGELRHGD